MALVDPFTREAGVRPTGPPDLPEGSMKVTGKAQVTPFESARPHRVSNPTGAVFSVTVHALLIGAVVLASRSAMSSPPDPDSAIAHFLFPTSQPTPRPIQEQLSYVGISSSTSPEVVAPRATAARSADTPEPPKQVASVSTPESKPEETQHAFSELDVDSAAARDAESAGPAYPPQLLTARIEGLALVQFIVDSTGRVDTTSFVIISATRPEFAEAVRSVLPRMKFKPAWLNGKHVPQLVELPFNFRIAKAAKKPELDLAIRD